jgi:hypothetical protein
MKYAEDLESRPRRDPNIEINVQAPATWTGVAYNPQHNAPRNHGAGFEFDFRGDGRMHTPRSGTATPDGHWTPSQHPRPPLGIYPATARHDSRSNSDFYTRSESAMSHTAGSPGQWVSDSRYGSQSNLLSRSGTPTPPVIIFFWYYAEWVYRF